MSNYFATELGLTKATRELLAKGVPHFVYPTPDFAPKPYVKPKSFTHWRKRGVKKAQFHFQEHRLFTVISNEEQF